MVEAFRDVASALEEKSTRINEAEGYLREQVPLARGQSRARILYASVVKAHYPLLDLLMPPGPVALE